MSFKGRSLIYRSNLRNQFELNCTSVFGGQGRGNGEMIDPSGLFIDSGGNIISADSKNDRIQVKKKKQILLFKNKTIIYLFIYLFSFCFSFTISYFQQMVNIKQHLN